MIYNLDKIMEIIIKHQTPHLWVLCPAIPTPINIVLQYTICYCCCSTHWSAALYLILLL
jgi:hypothetical protein